MVQIMFLDHGISGLNWCGLLSNPSRFELSINQSLLLATSQHLQNSQDNDSAILVVELMDRGLGKEML